MQASDPEFLPSAVPSRSPVLPLESGGARTRPVGDQLRDWRQRRHLSQLELSLDVDVSTRHLSYVETGRALPSRELLLRLAERLDVPPRGRNALLLAAGYAPMFRERPLDDPSLVAARAVIERVLAGHEPYPALAIDRHWTLLMANRAVEALFIGIEPALLAPPLNVLRLSLHPEGLAPRIANLAEWRAHLLHRVAQQVEASADPVLEALLVELRAYPCPARDEAPHAIAAIAVPLRIVTPHGTLSFISTTTIFGTPVDVTLAELALECFYPADEATADVMRTIMARP